MTVNRELFKLVTPDPVESLHKREDAYFFTRQRISRNLIHHTLIDSCQNFDREHVPYPFVTPNMLRPGTAANSKEFSLQNSALVILLNGSMPNKLRKHFRFREGNRLCKENLLEVAPDLPELNKYKWRMRLSNHKDFDTLMKLLFPLDYALLIQSRSENVDTWPFELTHFHVKIERLLDNAIRSLALHLNYLERGLYERGEKYVDLLEKKFFEYFNFYHNASGRRCASALATQLLAREKIPATIYVASQQTRCLTQLTTNGQDEQISIEQYILLNMDHELLKELKKWGRKNSLDIKKDFIVGKSARSRKMLFRVRFEHTEAGKPSAHGRVKAGINSREKWIRLKDESLIAINQEQESTISCSLVYRRSTTDSIASSGENL